VGILKARHAMRDSMLQISTMTMISILTSLVLSSYRAWHYLRPKRRTSPRLSIGDFVHLVSHVVSRTHLLGVSYPSSSSRHKRERRVGPTYFIGWHCCTFMFLWTWCFILLRHFYFDDLYVCYWLSFFQKKEQNKYKRTKIKIKRGSTLAAPWTDGMA
jgi:hypothetical protein